MAIGKFKILVGFVLASTVPTKASARRRGAPECLEASVQAVAENLGASVALVTERTGTASRFKIKQPERRSD